MRSRRLEPRLRRRPVACTGRSSFWGPAASSAPILCGCCAPFAATFTARPAASRRGGSRACRKSSVRMLDLLVDSNLESLLIDVRPRTVFHCVAYGAYSFETDSQLIYRTNFQFITRLLPLLESRLIVCLRSRGQFFGIRRQCRRAQRARSHGAQQRLCRLQGRRVQPDLLSRQAQGVSVCQPQVVLGVWPARRFGPVDSQPGAPRPGGTIPRIRQSGDLAGFRVRRRRERGVSSMRP